ncbi:calmodulin-binding transcription activator 4 [Cocos nucifera]|uniref:Calmodulin-binding transcription activator 4 n=1 Tax=Cocos nucifera TaxID=13894 RepID=A0A8K0IN27_COCNU|nr:calmodulin-binding transcription activator 4 [Cocos nucifera]
MQPGQFWSLFGPEKWRQLFQRVLRNFRNDGHLWRKKRNGRTLAEAHERLKVGNIEVLACYYARGEQNQYFQRRVYWMLDPAYEHIVFVHYREVAELFYAFPFLLAVVMQVVHSFLTSDTYEGALIVYCFTSFFLGSIQGRSVEPIFRFSTESSPTFNQSNSITDAQVQGFPSQINELNEQCQNSSSPVSVEEVSSEFVTGKTERPHLDRMDRSETYNQPLLPDVSQALRKLEEQLSLDDDDGGDIYSKEKLHPNCNQNEESEHLGLLNYETRDLSRETLDSLLDPLQHEASGYVEEAGLRDGSSTIQIVKTPECSGWSHGSQTLLNSSSEQNSFRGDSGLLTHGRDNNIHGLETVLLDENTVYSSSAFSEIWLEQSQLETPLATDSGLPIAQKPWFSICEISPEWAFSFESTKTETQYALHTKSRFGSGYGMVYAVWVAYAGHSWGILFGDTKVPLEIVQEGVFRCLTPKHDIGKVKLCITSGNGEPCSDVREFEFRSKPGTSSFSSTLHKADTIKSTEELLLLVRLVERLLFGHQSASVLQEGGVESYFDPSRKLKINEDWFGEIAESLRTGRDTPTNTMDRIVQELLKDKLQQWLSSKRLGNADQICELSKQEQCIIHMISGLGYDWALSPILNSGIGINFRDPNGWTALHWAARFGREEMVAALLAAGASTGAVTDPTSQDPVGKIPAALAAAYGHKGLAGYLSEAALTNHHFSLVTGKSEISKESGSAEAGVDTISQKSAHLQGGTEDQLSLRDSLEAVRNAAQAAARIQFAFRAYSFRKRRQHAAANQDKYGLSPEDIHGIKFHKAALSIQKNYRCWKGRKEFLTLRKHVVKIQARVRAYQARKKYKLLLTVSILEKIILRWSRRGVGLRRFRAEAESIDEEEEADILEIFRKKKVYAALDEAVSRVLSMVDSPEAQQQYRRMLERYSKAKVKKVERVPTFAVALVIRMDVEALGLTFSREELTSIGPPKAIMVGAIIAKTNIAEAAEQLKKKRSKKRHVAPPFEITSFIGPDVVSIEGGRLEVVEESTTLLHAPQPPASSLVPVAKAYAKLLEELVPLIDKERLLAQSNKDYLWDATEPSRHGAYFSKPNVCKKKLASPATFSKWLRRS